MAELSREFLEEVWREAKQKLPGWIYTTLRNQARARSGGRARHRDEQPNTLEKIALAEIKPSNLVDMPEDELRLAWSRLGRWHKNAKSRRRPVDGFVKAALWTMGELERRGLSVRESELAAAVAEAKKEQPETVKAETPVNSRELTTEETIEQVAERNAKFGQEEAGYEEPADPSAVCGACRFFLRDAQSERGTCVVVDGEVAWFGGCDLFIGAEAEARAVLSATKSKAATRDEVMERSGSVPTSGPEGAVIMFVGSSPGGVEAARREPLVGPAGETFHDLYLAPLGVGRGEVAVANAVPILLTDGADVREPTPDEVDEWGGWLCEELDRIDPGTIVALGEIAAKALGDRADFKLPHPASVRRFGDSGEVGRKTKRIKAHLAKVRDLAPSAPVEITKADPIKRIVYGVVLDPYGERGPEPDAHLDWNPPAAVEKASHDYMKGARVIGVQHQEKASATVVESWVEKYPEPERENYLAAMRGDPHKVGRRKFGTDVLHSGAWVLGVELGASEWQAYEDGELNAFSPAGRIVRTPITRAEMPKVTFVDLVEKPA